MFTESTSLRAQLTHRQKELERHRWEEQLKARRAQLNSADNNNNNLVAIDTQYKVWLKVSSSTQWLRNALHCATQSVL